MQLSQKIVPFLSYNNQAEEAARHYVSILPDSKIVQITKQPDTGEVMTVEFQLSGMNFVSLNVGMDWKFTESISLSVSCDTQEELDELWVKLSAGGEEIQCGWLKDKFGVHWQIVPCQILNYYSDPDPEKSKRVFHAMMQMKKLDIAKLEAAYEGQ
ncbi:VOC family protein [uncultured Rubinisphaera sp.]|uniref:VOC family protein n=1 Tax=uncultured Rubinisphaera sp. TaxID=1678686 RepID=UPI0030DAFA16